MLHRQDGTTAKAGKPMLALALELPPDTWNGKTFTTRVEARTYRPAGLESVAAGDLVSVSGDVTAEVQTYQGKSFARTIISGTITRVEFPAVAPDAKPRASTAVAPPRTRTAPNDYADDDDPGQP